MINSKKATNKKPAAKKSPSKKSTAKRQRAHISAVAVSTSIFGVVIAALIAVIITFGCLFTNELLALIRGEKLYTQSQVDAMQQPETPDEPDEPARTQIAVGDEISTFYLNTDYKVTDDIIMQLKDVCPRSNYIFGEGDVYTLIDNGTQEESVCLFDIISETSSGKFKYVAIGIYNEIKDGMFYTAETHIDGELPGWFLYEQNCSKVRTVNAVYGQEIWNKFISIEPFRASLASFRPNDEISSFYMNTTFSDKEIKEYIDACYRDMKYIEFLNVNGELVADLESFVMKFTIEEYPELQEDIYIIFLPNGKETGNILWASATFNLDGVSASQAGLQAIIGENGLIKDYFPKGTKIDFPGDSAYCQYDFAKFFSKTQFPEV